MPIAHTPDGAALAYDRAGAGSPLVLIHGITDSRRSWDPLIPMLAADHDVIAVDLRGHGQSSRTPPYDAFTLADDIVTVLDHAQAEHPMMIGHSLGGIVSTVYAARHEVRAIVNIDQPLELSPFHAGLSAFEPMLRGDAATFRSVMEAMTDAMFGPLPAAERSRLQAQWSPEQEVVLGVWDAVLTTSPEVLAEMSRELVSSVTAPYLTVLNDDVDGGYEVWLKEVMPTATIEVWPGSGHFPHLVDPQRFVQRVREFERTLAS
ncbi:MAG TPA: alpha/beta hydrolase [Acidimicrobiia bacterium]|nr:alpha/beta hydrolase [Acidimicrobiia bacterium]